MTSAEEMVADIQRMAREINESLGRIDQTLDRLLEQGRIPEAGKK